MLNATYPFSLPPLPYPYNSMEPFIDAETMHYHYDKHFGTYIGNLNKALAPYPQLHTMRLEQLLSSPQMHPPAVHTDIMHNGGGVYNHSIYFDNLAPAAQAARRRPEGWLADAVNRTFGSFEQLRRTLSDHATSVFGSGWSSLVLTRDKGLRIVDLHNQQTVAGSGALTIILIDVWEHAYYLKYKNLRSSYVENIWNLLTFPIINVDEDPGWNTRPW